MDKDELQKSVEATSLQIDADNLINITMDVTIKAIMRGTTEQPIKVVLDETEKFYMPSKTYRRAMIGCFGDDPKNWIGQRIRLARDADIMYAGVKVGGIVITHASIAAPLILMLAQKRGKKSAVKIDVLPAQKAAPKAAKPVAPVATPDPKPHARGTISGDADEGDLSMIPMIPKADMDKMLAAFANIGMDSAAVEAEYNKPIKDWSLDDFTEAREVFKSCKAAFDAKQAELQPTQEDVI